VPRRSIRDTIHPVCPPGHFPQGMGYGILQQELNPPVSKIIAGDTQDVVAYSYFDTICGFDVRMEPTHLSESALFRHFPRARGGTDPAPHSIHLTAHFIGLPPHFMVVAALGNDVSALSIGVSALSIGVSALGNGVTALGIVVAAHSIALPRLENLMPALVMGMTRDWR